MKSDLEIAQEATLQPIMSIAEDMGLLEDEVELYGKYKAKISLDVLDRNQLVFPFDLMPRNYTTFSALALDSGVPDCCILQRIIACPRKDCGRSPATHPA